MDEITVSARVFVPGEDALMVRDELETYLRDWVRSGNLRGSIRSRIEREHDPAFVHEPQHMHEAETTA